MLKLNKKYPLDYILYVPEKVRERKKKQELLRLENILKNIVFRRIIEIRALRNNQIKIKRLLSTFNQLDKKEKDIALDKLRQAFSSRPIYNNKGEDKKFEKVLNNFDRVHKLLD